MEGHGQTLRGFFPTTRWTVVRRLQGGQGPDSQPAWDQFVTDYRQPLITWLVQRSGNRHQAEEVVQSLMVKLFTRENALARVSPAGGRMRTWLLTCLRNHWFDALRRERDVADPIDEERLAEAAAEENQAYDLEWARTLAGRALRATRLDYEKRGNAALFEELLSAIDDPRHEPQTQRAARLGMKPNSFAVALMRLRERVAARLWEEVALTVQGGAPEIDAELRHLISVLARHGGLRQAMDLDAP